jgi:hypothetical protein
MKRSINRQRGKNHERAIAKRLGGKRVGIFGGQDVEHDLYSIEAKSRQKFVATGWMDQAVRNAPANKIPVVIVHVTNQRRDNDLVMMRMKDFEDWHGTLKEGEK